MKKTLKRLPVLLALVSTILVSACSEIDVKPTREGDDDDTPIIIYPDGSDGSNSTSADTLSIG